MNHSAMDGANAVGKTAQKPNPQQQQQQQPCLGQRKDITGTNLGHATAQTRPYGRRGRVFSTRKRAESRRTRRAKVQTITHVNATREGTAAIFTIHLRALSKE